MNAHYYWQSKKFNMMHILSALSLSHNTSADKIYICFPRNLHPLNIYWRMLSFIPKVHFIDLPPVSNADSTDDVFQNAEMLNLIAMKNNSGMAVGFDSYFIKDICKINTRNNFFCSDNGIRMGFISAKKNNKKIDMFVKEILKEHYEYGRIVEMIASSCKCKNIFWDHSRSGKMDKEKHIVNFNGNDGFTVFNEDDFELFINAELFESMKTMLMKCRKKDKYRKIAEAVHL
jgi:hypothetical protein